MTDTDFASDFCEVVSEEETRPIRGGYAGRTFTIQPKGTVQLPLEAVIVNFGDWTRTETHEYMPRSRELLRIKGRYGGLEDDSKWEANRPHVQIYHQGQRVIPIWEDPDGSRQPTPEGGMTVEQRMEYLQRQMAELQGQMRAEGKTVALEDSRDLAARRRGRAPKVTAAEEAPRDVPVGAEAEQAFATIEE